MMGNAFIARLCDESEEYAIPIAERVCLEMEQLYAKKCYAKTAAPFYCQAPAFAVSAVQGLPPHGNQFWRNQQPRPKGTGYVGS
uniref:Uncharacterized protein n=1 Tax=uncultured bacterium contig00033 TaxID=1181522 RepID=A0A806KEI5_9BACT|nr:hypothetical protein [uncultured bacterium contig00033]